MRNKKDSDRYIAWDQAPTPSQIEETLALLKERRNRRASIEEVLVDDFDRLPVLMPLQKH